MFYEIASQYTSPFHDFKPFPSLSDREAYQNIAEPLRSELLSLGENFLNFSYPSIPATSFMAFCRVGNRVDFEYLYMTRRRALNALVIAECIENKGRFLDDIINGIFAICEESAWQLPAHNSYIRNTPNFILPDATEPVIDLFACETGAQLAMVYYLLKDSLDQVSPFINKRILSELKQRIFTPYLRKHFWWMGQGEEPMCNWTIWCTQNVLIAAFATDTLVDTERREVFLKASKSIDYFLKDYGEDGCCDEGAQYYRHAGLCLFNAMEVLNSITNQAFASLYQNNKIQNIAHYILNVHIDDKYYANFADCSPVAGRAGVREYLFGKRLESKDLMLFGAQDYRANTDKITKEELNLFYRVQAVFTDSEIWNYSSTTPLGHKDIFYKSVGLFMARDTSLTLAVKAGDNDDSHNHNDTGSFIVYKDGKPMIIDVGVESYTAKTFSSRRYEIWTMQSAYHNLPTFGTIMQKDGADYAATEVEVSLAPETCSISMDIAGCYPKETGVSSYKRNIVLEKEKKISISDTFHDLPEGSFLSLMTYEKPWVDKNMIHIGNLGCVQIITEDNSIDYEIEEIPITDARLQTAWDHEVYRIKLALRGTSIAFEIRK